MVSCISGTLVLEEEGFNSGYIFRFGLGSPPLAVESSVVHPQLNYQGYMDCVALYRDPKSEKNGRLMLIDWKTAGKAKRSIGDTYDNPLQVAAYVGAFNHDPRY